jgi:hypothetical protein
LIPNVETIISGQISGTGPESGDVLRFSFLSLAYPKNVLKTSLPEPKK